jgi:hypothetical protein
LRISCVWKFDLKFLVEASAKRLEGYEVVTEAMLKFSEKNKKADEVMRMLLRFAGHPYLSHGFHLGDTWGSGANKYLKLMRTVMICIFLLHLVKVK